MSVRRDVTLSFLASALTLGCHTTPPGQPAVQPSFSSTSVPRPEAAWTLLIYMAADDDLEQAALSNVAEMAEVGSSARVNVVLQIDRAPADKKGGGFARSPLLNLRDFHTTKRLRVERGSLVELADLGETCTCDPDPLASFITWGLTTFPAKKAALVLWDHGGASHGFGWDVTSNNQPLRVVDLGHAVAKGLSGAGRSHFDVLGFDACLMSNLGVAYELRRSTDIFIGSEEFEPQAGWSYAPIVRAMAGDASPRSVAETVIRSFEDACRASNALDLCTLAAIDASKLDDVVGALDTLAVRLQAKSQDVADWYPIARARTAAEQYGAGGGDQSPYAAVDAVDFANDVARLTGDPNRVAAAVQDATLFSFRGSGKPNAHGISLTFPRQSTDRVPADDTLLLATRPDARWDAFLHTYLDLVAADRTSPTVTGLGITPSPGAFDASGVLADLDLADLSDVVGVMDAKGGLTLLSLTSTPPSSKLATFHWAKSLPAFGDEHALLSVTIFEEPSYLEPSGRRVHIASLGGVLHPHEHGPGDAPINVVVFLKVADGDAPSLVGVYRQEGSGPGSEVEIHPEDRLAPTVVTVAVDGRSTRTAAKETVAMGDGTKLRLVTLPAPPGKYAVGFRLTDYAANRRWEVMNVDVR